MTREEAIEVLKEISATLKSWSGFTSYPQAIDMAIEALSEPRGDLISREDAIDAICKSWCYVTYMDCPHADDGFRCDGCDDIEAIKALPSALADIGDYADRLWKIAYERGKAEAEAVQGEWIDIDNYYRMATCSHCHKVTMFEKWGENTKPYDFCPNCGTRMKTEQEIEMGNKYMRILERIPNEILRELWLSDEGGER